MDNLSYGELRAEIEREETQLGELYHSLHDADQRLEDLEEQIKSERERDEVKRYLQRQRIIDRLTRRIETRARRIQRLIDEAVRYENRARLLTTSVVYRYTFLEVAARLWRSVYALRGWQTRDRRSRAAYRGWQVREAPLTERIRQLLADRDKWRIQAELLADEIKLVEAQLTYKRGILPELVLARVTVALYLIIEEGEHEYPRDRPYYEYHKPRYRRLRVRVRYPKGRFQSLLQCDGFIDPDTGVIKRDTDPFLTLEKVMRREVADEFMEEFSLKSLEPEDLTLGEASLVPGEEEIGKPPLKLYIARTDEETGKEWRTTVNRYIMTDTEYYNLTIDMTEYIEALEALG